MSWQPTAIVAAPAARPLRHWSHAQLERALRAVERACHDWGARWQLAARATAAVNACDDAETADSPDRAWTRGHLLHLSAGVADATVALQALLFGPDKGPSNPPIAQELAAEALADLLRGLGQLGAGLGADGRSSAGAPAQADARRWSGAVRIRLELARDGHATTWHLQCSDALAAKLCGAPQLRAAAPRPALEQLADAIALQPLQFKVCLDATTLTLGTLQSLQLGDVLPLSHRLDVPLHVVGPDAPAGAPVFCAAYLGSRDHHRAVELVPAASATHSIES